MTDCLDTEQVTAFAAGDLDDDALRKVDAHLDGCPACLDLIAAYAAAPVPAPRRVGRYRIEERLGSGALGVVYAAVDETLERRVALKLLRSDRRDPEGVERRRMLREARALAKLDHPNIVGVYDAGEVDGVGFIAMRLVTGRTLRRHCRELAWPAVLVAYMQAARGLIAAHEAGLVHRDFKPDNVLVGEGGGVYVCDFGLAGWSPATAATGTMNAVTHDSTATGHTPGTPAYMAPELWQGAAASPASDQFAFCVSLWESLAGRPPFDATSVAQLRLQLQSPPPPTRLRAAGVPAGLTAVLVRGLAVDPHARHESMQTLLSALSHMRWRRRARVPLALGVAALVSAWLALGPAAPDDPCADSAGAPALAATLTRTDLDPAAAKRLRTELDAYADRMAAIDHGQCQVRQMGTAPAEVDRCLEGQRAAYDQLVTVLDELPPDVVRTRGLAAVHALPAPSGCLQRRSARSTWLADSELRARLGPTVLVADRVRPLLEVGAVDQARVQLDAALTELDAAPPSSYLVAARLARLGVDEMSGQPVQAAAYEALIELATAHDDLPLAARLWSRRLGSAANRGAMDELPTLLDTAKWAFDLADRPAEVAAIFHEASGFAAMQLRRYDAASTHLQAAIDSVVSLEGPTHPKLAELRGAWAMLEYRQGNVPHALEVATEAWAALEPAVDPGFSALPMLALNIATFHADLAHPQQAVAWAHRGLAAMDQGVRVDPLLRGGLVEIVVLHAEVAPAVAAGKALLASAQHLDPYIRGRAARTAARGALRSGDLETARIRLEAAQVDFEAAKATGDVVAVRWDRAKVASRAGDLETAAGLMAEVVAQEELVPGFDAAQRVQFRIETAELALARARPQDAARALAEARDALVGLDTPTLRERVDALQRKLIEHGLPR